MHVVITDAFLRCHELWGTPIPGGADAYVREWATAGELIGVANPPRSQAAPPRRGTRHGLENGLEGQ